MSKKTFIIVLFVMALITLNFSAAQEIDNSTQDDLALGLDENMAIAQSSSKIPTQIDVVSNTTFDVVGDNFQINLSDENNNLISNSPVSFTVHGVTYNKNTNSKGIASLPIRLVDGSYNITTKFLGNSKYQASSKTTTITINNTRVVDEGLSNSEIQKIVDNAKANNIILFKGSSYENVNLVIDKRLTLTSNSNTVLKSGSSSPVISIRGKDASSSIIKGFNIQGKGDGISITDAIYVIVRNNDISVNGNAIVATGTRYLNITKNNIVKNGKNGIVLIKSEDTHIYNNKINSNAGDGIQLTKSSNTYIYSNTLSNNGGNGIQLTKTVNKVNYGSGPSNVFISKNTLSKNGKNGILVENAGNDINVNSNTLYSNWEDGISISKIGNNKIQSNIITDNHGAGLNFIGEYELPKSQDISYNAIFSNVAREVEAKDTFYDSGNRLSIGDNWYSDFNTLCPKIKTNNIKFNVKQIGDNLFQAVFTDSKGNVASLLPDRELSYQLNNGQTVTQTISGGSAIFAMDAENGDIIKATVDYSDRKQEYSADVPTDSNPTNGVSPSYDYPSIQYDSLYDDIGNGGGNGDGSGNGNGNGGTNNRGNGQSNQESENNGNSTHGQKANPGSNSNNPVDDASQSYNAQDVSQAGASESSAGDVGDSGSQSVIKQIIIDEDEFFKVTGISFIILLIIFTILFYYREDIKEMKSKM